jgi:protein-L-isoaspartate O-methyltransferase
MDSLTSDPVASVLKRLFREAELADRSVMEDFRKRATAQDVWSEIIEEETKDYRSLYRKYANNFLSVAPEFGRLLYMCARASRAKQIIEFGTSFGVSTIHLACALRDNGGGRLIGTELESEKAQRARQNLADAGLSDLVEIRVGDALETLKAGIEGEVDLLLPGRGCQPLSADPQTGRALFKNGRIRDGRKRRRAIARILGLCAELAERIFVTCSPFPGGPR